MFLFNEVVFKSFIKLFVLEGKHTGVFQNILHTHLRVLVNVGEELEVRILCCVKSIGVRHFVKLENRECRYTVGNVVASRGNGHTVLPIITNYVGTKIGANALVKEMKKLKSKASRYESNLFIAEGINIAKEIILNTVAGCVFFAQNL